MKYFGMKKPNQSKTDKAQRCKFDNVKMVDFDAPNCVCNINRRACGRVAIAESGLSHLCDRHWWQLRIECDDLIHRIMGGSNSR